MADLKAITGAFTSGKTAQAAELIEKALAEGVPAAQILRDAIVAPFKAKASAPAAGGSVSLKSLAEAIIGGKREVAVELTKKALEAGISAEKILNEGLIAGMNEVGRRFKANEFYVPEVLIAARAMSNAKEAATRPGAMEILQPALSKAGVQSKGKVIIGTVKGDLHDIGKNLVAMMLKGAGFEVIDLEIDVPAEKFVESAKKTGAKVIGLSALLTTTMPQMKTVIEALKAAGLKDVKVMIGGAPVTQSYADEIGANGYAPDAASAVDVATRLLSEAGKGGAAAPVKAAPASKAPAKASAAKAPAKKAVAAKKAPVAKKAAAKKGRK